MWIYHSSKIRYPEYNRSMKSLKNDEKNRGPNKVNVQTRDIIYF